MSITIGTAPAKERAIAEKIPGKRLFDIVVTSIALPFLLPVSLFIAVAIKVTSKGPVLYWSDRVGINNTIFRMPKYRTMRVGTPVLATHLMARTAERYITPIGSLLRRTSLDELPQLISVLRGEMSLVGPRPALFNQHDLIALRTEAGVHGLLPGVTGWAQVNGRDELPIPVKVAYDAEYLRSCSLSFDRRIIRKTLTKVLLRDGVAH